MLFYMININLNNIKQCNFNNFVIYTIVHI